MPRLRVVTSPYGADDSRRATDGLDWQAAGPAASNDDSPAPAPPGPGTLSGQSHSKLVLLTLTTAVIAALLGGMLGGVVAVQLAGESGRESDAAADPTPQTSPAVLRAEVTGAIAEAATSARPSVVRIESRRRGQPGTEVGSGVVIDSEGHIVTNAHVVAGADTLSVFTQDGTELQALLIGHDAPFTDVAVLQVPPGSTTPIAVGDSEALALADPVVAIGNPLSEFAGTITVGIVSGLDRVRTLDGRRYDDLVQTDAALNHGNSGGALVNLAGHFIGMPTVIIRETNGGETVEGIGFALPSNHVLEIAALIIAAGSDPERPTLGVEHLELTADSARRAGVAETTRGVLITAVLPGGPADAAGILAGDVLSTVDGAAVGAEYPLLNALLDKSPGEVVTVVLDRNGAMVETQVQLGRRS